MKYHVEKCGKISMTKQLVCVNDIDFKIKVHALRKSFEIVFAEISTVEWFTNSLENILKCLIVIGDRHADSFEISFKKFMAFCQNPETRESILQELEKRGLNLFTFYDIVFDFCILESLDELDSPPAAIKAVL
ncbi:hypothetical protein MXB_210, partial [Myxobolus squamalis]